MSAPTPPPTHYLTSRGMRPIPKRDLERAARLTATAAADAEVHALREDLGLPFPQTRADCPSFRPCPHISCRYHLAATHHPKRPVIHTDPDDWTSATPTCALDVAAQGPHSPQQIADLWGVTRQRITQIEEQALAKLRASGLSLTDLFDGPERHRPDLAPDPPSADWLPSSSSPAGIAITAAAERVKAEVAQVMATRTRTLDATESAEAVRVLSLHPKAPKGITCPTTTTSPSPTPKPSPSPAATCTTPPAPQSHPTTKTLSADDLAHIAHLTSLALTIGARP